MNRCYTTIEMLRSHEEIESLNEEIKPLPDSMLIIPLGNEGEAKPIIQLSSIGTWNSVEYILHNNGDLYLYGEFVENITHDGLEEIIQNLNKKGLFNVSYEKIQDKIWLQRRACFIDLFFLDQGRPIVFDGGTDILLVTLKNFMYYISYDAVWFDAEIFPTCQDIQILNNSIKFLRHKFEFYREN